MEIFKNKFDSDYTGIGVLLETDEKNQVVIKAIFADSIAATAGFLRGDIIYSVNGILAKGKSTKEVSELLRGEKNQLVTVEIERNGYIVKYEMQRKTMNTPSAIYWMLNDGIAYMLIEQFTIHTGEQINSALEYLTTLGMKSLVLDLRNCPGGVMQAAGYSAGLLSEDGPIYFNVGRDGYESFYVMENTEEAFDIPIAVLVNEETASAAELLAAVLQDTNRAMIVGMPTFGKGVFQTLLTLPSGAGIYITTGKYITRGYQDITELGGVTPDLLVRDVSAQEDQAILWLENQQSLAHNFVFTINSNKSYADKVAFYLYHIPFISNQSSYLPASEILRKMGWELYYYNDCWYGFDGIHRMIIDLSEKKILSGNRESSIIVKNNTIYLPSAFLRNLNYTVNWDGKANTVTVSR